MEWFDYSIPLCPPGGLDSNKFNALECMFNIQVKDEIFDKDWLKIFATEILNAEYKNTDVAEVMKGLTHLDAHQKQTYFECLGQQVELLRRNMEWFDYSIPLCPPGGLDSKKFNALEWYALQRTFTFLWDINTWCSILSKHNICYASIGIWKLNSFHPLIWKIPVIF